MKLLKHKSPLLILLMVIVAALIVIVPMACDNGSSGGDGDGTGDGETPGDTTPPTVMSTQPGNGDTGVAPNSIITVTFSEAMDESTITVQSFSVTAEPDPNAAALTAEAVAGSVSYSNLMATFTPEDDLVFGSLFTVRLSTGVTDLAGNGLAADYVFSFTTGEEPDTTGPEIVSRDPGVDDTGVDLDVQVTVEFSEPVNASSVSGDTIVLQTSGYELPSEVALSPSGLTATLVPESGFMILADYEVTVSGDVEDLAGNKLGDDVAWGFQTRDGAWGSTIQSYNTVNNYPAADDPSVAFHGAGMANILWSAFNSNPTPYAYDTETAGYDRHEDPPWSTEVANDPLSSSSGGSSTQPYIASNRYGGTSFGVWLGGEIYSYVYAKRFTSGEWDASEPQISQDYYSYQPVVGVDEAGNAIALWRYETGGYSYVYSSEFTDTLGSWGSPDQRSSGQYGEDPQIAVRIETGDAVCVWVDLGADYYVYGADYDPDLGWGDPVVISSTVIAAQALPQIAMDWNGNAVAVWRGGDNKIYANRYRASDGTWQEEVAVSSEGGSKPRVAMDVYGNAIAVWEHQSGSQIFFNRYDHGVNWPTWETTGAEAGVALSPPAPVEYAAVPQIAFDVAGNGIAVWEEDWVIKVKRYPHGLTLDEWKYSSPTEPLIETVSEGNYNISPAIDLGPNGRAIVVWRNITATTIDAAVFE